MHQQVYRDVSHHPEKYKMMHGGAFALLVQECGHYMYHKRLFTHVIQVLFSTHCLHFTPKILMLLTLSTNSLTGYQCRTIQVITMLCPSG